MSLRGVNEKRTLCEVLREINDLIQQNPLFDKINPKLVEAESMAKKMARKLYEYNKDFENDWWEKNPDYEQDVLKRLNNPSYISDHTEQEQKGQNEKNTNCL